MTDQQAHAFWVIAPGRGEIRPEEVPSPADGEVQIGALYSAISRGTESAVFEGRVPASEHARMRAPFQAGDFPAPVKYGYSSVGRIERGPADLQGRVAFVLYPHQTRYTVPRDAVHLVPDGVPPARAVLAANLETAINGLWDAAPRIGDRITVIGAGTVGCLVAWLAGRIPGSRVELVDINPRRSAVAQRLGVAFATPGTLSRDSDLVVHASGASAGLQLALEVAGFESTILEMSWYADRKVSLSLGEAFHARRLTIKSSQVGVVASAQRARWDSRRRMALALALLADPALDAVITGDSAFETLPRLMADLSSSPEDTICQRIDYGKLA